ncbi:hypothetical protein NBRC110019_20080 [Neptunitalea chrysea]|uniref:Uncharacterized protein n=1 Tax=Neptunitalea chrysea TaxID=1647581 RepID=A0A9W6B5E7_9FLAO|nr:hypothetical protein [Neptunitalea chrysea]GLB52968.1 hypothetical protein NBRC110019_20080 [Neptunitalea chrysea]
MNCPKCNHSIPSNDINIQADIAKCTQCGYVFKPSGLVTQSKNNFNIQDVPNGAWYRKERNNIILGANLQSKQIYLFIAFFSVWLVVFGTGIGESNGETNELPPFFFLPFGVGFIIISTVIARVLFGKVEFTLDKRGGKVFTGVGSIGVTRTFLWEDIDNITERESNFRSFGKHNTQIALEGKKRIMAGIGVSDERRYYLMRALTQVMNEYQREW